MHSLQPWPLAAAVRKAGPLVALLLLCLLLADAEALGRRAPTMHKPANP